MKPPIQSRTDLATWIESCVLGDLRTLLLGVDRYYALSSHVSIEGRPLGSANFLLVAGCCSALDYFAFLFKGRGSNEANVKAFIERFLQPIDSRYSEVGLILGGASVMAQSTAAGQNAFSSRETHHPR